MINEYGRVYQNGSERERINHYRILLFIKTWNVSVGFSMAKSRTTAGLPDGTFFKKSM
jgi:hypothetical protein